MALAANAKNDMSKVSEAVNENLGGMKHYDADATKDKVQHLWAEVNEKRAMEEKKSAELAAIHVNDEDISLVADALSVSHSDARGRLQKNKGDVLITLREAVGLIKIKH